MANVRVSMQGTPALSISFPHQEGQIKPIGKNGVFNLQPGEMEHLRSVGYTVEHHKDVDELAKEAYQANAKELKEAKDKAKEADKVALDAEKKAAKLEKAKDDGAEKARGEADAARAEADRLQDAADALTEKFKK